MSHEPNLEEVIFNGALELKTPGERLAFLAQACGDNSTLRSRIEALLKTVEPSDPVVSEPVTSPLVQNFSGRLGPYRLLEKIGEGGCGIVYRAEQEYPLPRRVALKVIKSGTETRSVLNRFETERRVMALMDHANIAKVLDSGATEDGHPFFVMELVRGLPITRYCEEHQLPVHERLALFVQVCQAIQHAHDKGAIHQDIKPSNVLVALDNGMPTVKVVDFGIGGATQASLKDLAEPARFAAFIGSPTYLSPESMVLGGLEIDSRSDIYGLGVILYELLTGQPLFEAERLLKAGLDEVRHIMREEDPLKPSIRLAALPAAELAMMASRCKVAPSRLIEIVRDGLDTIAMKCLQKDRRRRYESAAALIADVCLYIANRERRPIARILKKLWRKLRQSI